MNYLDCTTLERLKSYMKMNAQVTKEDDALTGLIGAASSLIAQYLDRHMIMAQRTELYDVDDDQRFLWLKGWPFKEDPVTAGQYLVEIKNDVDYPQDWLGDALTQGDDYLLYPSEQYLGKVQFRCFLTGGVQGLRVVYTAGMATKTQVSGAAGNCASPGGGADDQFTDINATFVDDLLTTDMHLVITDNKNGNAGTYPITAVISDTVIEVAAGSFPAPGVLADEVYEIQGAGLVGLYPQVELACQEQVTYWYKRKEQPEVSSIANAGGNVTYVKTRPIDVKLYNAQGLQTEVMLKLDKFRQPVEVERFG